MVKYHKLFSNMALVIFMIGILFRTAAGFMCYKCSYSIWSEGSLTGCIDDPDSLGRGDRLYCNSTSHCVFSERYRMSDGKIVSYFRTCSGETWGNECKASQSHLTCKGSCQGDYCNKDAHGDRHVEYLENHKGNIFGESSASSMGNHWRNFIMCVCAVLFVL